MKIFLLSIVWVMFSATTLGQDIPANKLVNIIFSTQPKAENFLVSSSFSVTSATTSNDTTYKTYEFRPVKNKKPRQDSTVRSVVVAGTQNQYYVTYHTSSQAEYTQILAALKKEGYKCDYEKDEAINLKTYVYQLGDRTAEVCVNNEQGNKCYCIKMHRQQMPESKDLQAADDLFKFTSHEYLAYYFGEKNVKKDLYYFSTNDIVNCSVLFMNTNRQVIFVWKDDLNRRGISNLIFGGQNKLKSQHAVASSPMQNQWRLKSGLRTGMHLVELHQLNKKRISFCGGNAPNPGLILPESSGAIDFANADVVLSCVNCTDEKFVTSQVMYSEEEVNSGRIIFVQSIVLYPSNNY